MLVRNSAIFILARVLPGILGIVTTAVLTRVLNPELYGIYGFILIVMMLVSNFCFDWLGPTFLRFYEARRSDPSTFATFVHIFMLIVLISAAVAAAGSTFDFFGLANVPAFLFGLALAWGYSWFELASQLEIANFRPLRYLRMTVSRAALILVGAGAAAWITHDPLWTAALTAFGVLGGAIQGSFWGQPIGLRYFNRKLAREIFGFGIPVAASLALLGLVNNGTRALVGALDSAAGLGLYTAAYVLVQNSLLFFASGVASAGYSMAVRTLEQGDLPGAQRQMSANGILLFAVVAPSCLGIALTAPSFTTIMLGHDFRSTAVVLAPWMAAAAFFASIRAYYFDFAFHLGRRPILQVWVMAVAAAAALGLSALLIPRMGPVGAAIAVTAAMAVSLCHSAAAGRKVFLLPIPASPLIRIAASCAVMAIIVLLLPSGGTAHFLLQVLFGAMGYACSAVALNVLDLRMTVLSFLERGRRRPKPPGQP